MPLAEVNNLSRYIQQKYPQWIPPWIEQEQALLRQMAEHDMLRRMVLAPERAGGVPQVQRDEDMAEKLVNDFTIGCDPEFVALSAQGTVHNVARDFGNDASGPVGFDHSGLEVEIRPKPTRGTYALLKNIRNIILTNERLRLLRNYKWRAGAVVPNGARNLTLGGHVHLDILPGAQYDPTDRTGEKFDSRIKALDRYTKYLEGLDILPRDESSLRRDVGDPLNAGKRYGTWGDWRPAGEAEGRVRMEYRVMASWLYDPATAYLALTGAKLATVAPQLALDALKARTMSYENLKTFFELFRHKDTNARRALDKVLYKNLNQIQAQPDVDFREKWEAELPL